MSGNWIRKDGMTEGRNDGKGKHYMPQPFYGGGIKMKFFENIELCVLC